MTTQEAVMTTQEVASRFSELAKENRWDLIQSELFDEDAESLEPPQAFGLPTVKGIEAIKKKGQDFNDSIEEMHGGWASDVIVGGTYFSVAMGMDVTMKGMGRAKMDEVAVYQVKNGKIIREQFFY